MSTSLRWRPMRRWLKRLKIENLRCLPALLIMFLFAFHVQTSSTQPKTPTIEYFEPSEIIILQGNSLVANSNPNLPETPKVLASMVWVDGEIKTLVQNSYLKLYNLALCESSFRPEVCSYASCRSGMGLVGIIPSTWNTTLTKMEKAGAYLPDSCKVSITTEDLIRFKLGDRSHPIFIPECNLTVGLWLLENEGISHWNSSYACWSKL